MPSITVAQTCPSIAVIQFGAWQRIGWQLMDAVTGNPATPEQAETFAKTAIALRYAHWQLDQSPYNAQCFYSNNLAFYLGKNISHPRGPHWQWSNNNTTADCFSDLPGCLFNDD